MKNNKINESALVKKIMKEILPILEQSINEYNSTEWNDIADRFDSMHNTNAGAYARQRGAEARERELHTEYTETMEELSNIDIEGKKFIIGRYIPSNIFVLIYLKNAKQAAIVRIGETVLRNIVNTEIVQDIASLYNRKPISKDNVNSIAIAFDKDIRSARRLAREINDTLDVNINYHYFYGDKPYKDPNKETRTEGKYDYVGGFDMQGLKVRIAKSTADQLGYSIFYILIGNENKSFMMTVYKMMKGLIVNGAGKPGPAFRKLQSDGKTDGIAAPTPKGSHITNVYDFFKNLPDRTMRLLVDNISKRTDMRLRMEDIENGYNAAVNGKNASSEEEIISDVPAAGNNATDGDDFDDFMNF